MSVYVFADVSGPVLWLPLRDFVPVHPLVPVQEVVLVDVHMSVELPLYETISGSAPSVSVGGSGVGAEVGVIVGVAVGVGMIG